MQSTLGTLQLNSLYSLGLSRKFLDEWSWLELRARRRGVGVPPFLEPRRLRHDQDAARRSVSITLETPSYSSNDHETTIQGVH